jgi:hypothetical protein
MAHGTLRIHFPVHCIPGYVLFRMAVQTELFWFSNKEKSITGAMWLMTYGAAA